MSVSVDVQTNLRDPNLDDDDGTRRIYIEGQRMKAAVREACAAAGAPQGVEVGGELHVMFTGFGTAEAGLNPPKEYQARYTPPGVTAANGVLMGGQPQQAPAQGTPVVQQQAPGYADPWAAPLQLHRPRHPPPRRPARCVRRLCPRRCGTP